MVFEIFYFIERLEDSRTLVIKFPIFIKKRIHIFLRTHLDFDFLFIVLFHQILELGRVDFFGIWAHY